MLSTHALHAFYMQFILLAHVISDTFIPRNGTSVPSFENDCHAHHSRVPKPSWNVHGLLGSNQPVHFCVLDAARMLIFYVVFFHFFHCQSGIPLQDMYAQLCTCMPAVLLLLLMCETKDRTANNRQMRNHWNGIPPQDPDEPDVNVKNLYSSHSKRAESWESLNTSCVWNSHVYIYMSIQDIF